MTRPPTIPEAESRGLLAKSGAGIHTFSNGSSWDYWADANCFECWFWEPDGTAGELCAFEGAALLGMASPDLARMFGWAQHTAEYGERFGWRPPAQCAFFRSRKRDDGEDNPPPPDPDPTQLVLLADPTEDAAIVTNAAVTSITLRQRTGATIRY